MNLSRNQIIMLGAVVLVIGGVFAFFKFVAKPTPPPQVTLQVWGIDTPDIFQSLIASYGAMRPNVTVQYTYVPPEQYRKKLFDALAAGQGPDVFMVDNNSIARDKNVMAPANQYTSIMNAANIPVLFPKAVEQDFVAGGQIYAAPLYMDTLLLAYNKQMFDAAGIVYPPKTWEEFQEDVVKLRVVEPNSKLVRAGAAIGTGDGNIDVASDLLMMLMMQNGTVFIDPVRGIQLSTDENARLALNYYLQFANSASSFYTWNDAMPKSIDAFATGKTAMVFGYQETLAKIASKNPYLEFRVAAVPQTSNGAPVTFPRYRGLAVSKQSKVPAWGWDFAALVATNDAAAGNYTNQTGKMSALLSVVNTKMNDPVFSIFARQVLTARSWYQPDPDRIRGIFNTVITEVLSGKETADRAMRRAGDAISQAVQDAAK